LIGLECRANRGVIIDVLGHRVEHRREGHERYERWIETLLLDRVGECHSRKIAVLFQPIIGIDDLLRVAGCRANLREQGVRIKCDWREQLFQLIAARHILRLSHSTDKEKVCAPAEQTPNLTSQHLASPFRSQRPCSGTPMTVAPLHHSKSDLAVGSRRIGVRG
jgi:hypothetical protein